jgi:uncharacterized RDD family membrane protein YckC
MFCSHCGAANVDGSNFCAGCGLLLSAQAPSGATAFSRAPGTPAVVIRHYAGFWRRFAALFLDGVILGCGSLAVAVVVGVLATVSGADFATGAAAGYYLTYIAGSWLYFALQESSSLQATIGKRALGIFVTDTEGQRISFGRATGRVFAKLLNAMTIGIGWLLAAFTPEKRALHDYVAGTLVLARDDSRKTSGVVIAVLAALAVVPMIGNR